MGLVRGIPTLILGALFHLDIVFSRRIFASKQLRFSNCKCLEMFFSPFFIQQGDAGSSAAGIKVSVLLNYV